MKTILAYLRKINPLETEKSVYNEAIHAGASEFLYSISQNKDAFILTVSELGFVYHKLKVESQDALQKNCSFDLPMVYAEEPKPKKKEERKRKDKKIIYPTIFDFCKNGGNLREAVFKALQTLTKSWIYICSWIEGKYRCFLSNAKGTPAYCKKYYWRIHDFCKQCDDFYKHKYFLTLTMSQREYKTDLQRAWSVIQNNLSHFLKKWQAKYQGDYACALEAHKSGFPHIHIVLYTNAEIVDPKERYDRFKKAVCLCDGEMFDFVKDYWKLGISVLKVNYRKNTCDYLAKYISKAEEADLRNYSMQNLKDDSIFKEVMTLLLPMVFSIRQFKISQGKFNKKESEGDTKQFEDSETSTSQDKTPEVKDFLLEGAELEEFRTLLKTLCTKLPPSCLKSVYSKTGLDFQKAKPITPESVENLPIHRNILFSESGKRLSCKGCVKKSILQFCISGEMDMFMPKENWFFFTDLIFDRAMALNPSVWHSIKRNVVEEEAKTFLNRLFYTYKDLGTQKEIRAFASGVYCTDRKLFRLVFPKKWHKYADFLGNTESLMKEKLNQNQILFLKEVVKTALA